MKKHQKHAKLTRKNIGNFATNEIAIMGTTCGEIKKFAGEIASNLPHRNPAFLDMDHKTDEEELEKSFYGEVHLQVTDKIKFHRLDVKSNYNSFEKRQLFNGSDILIVNGNHYEASEQLLFIDDRKPLIKKIQKVKKPIGIVFSEGQTSIPQEVLDVLPELNDLPKWSIEKEGTIKEVADYIDQYYKKPTLKGLVLVGGKSTRMGKDKSTLKYHDVPQWQYAKNLLSKYCKEVYLSTAHDSNAFEDQKTISDKFIGLGPMGGILSAFQEDPNAAWVVIACDLPLLSEKTLDDLVNQRDTSKYATSFKSPSLDFPEPLICIWEPRSYGKLLEFLSWGYSCPRKALINSDINLIIPEFEEELTNANTPEEYKKIKSEI
ncbi:NTP transferase domain-containing protein [Flammeovirga sp. MY04]|uniref:NTP transferase domain-containing protein n=1 Tax=Flammeovirga sp. MY04 TaxID=1191459 RepID=UPI001981EF92|nr:NTP transferase domain-containing protein [Flammeovirga sp. MY04]